MSDDHEVVPLSPDDRIDLACDRFEAEWNAGGSPRIEDYVRDAPDPDRSGLLRELIALELQLRRTRCEKPTPEDYLDQFPGRAVQIKSPFVDAAPIPETLLHATEGAPANATSFGHPYVPSYEILGELGRGGEWGSFTRPATGR